MVDNTNLIEVNLMYKHIKDIETPEEALKKLAETELEMGWRDNVTDIRFMTYGVWLDKHGMVDWFQALKNMKDMFDCLDMGLVPEMPPPPKDWINPIPYFKGEIPESKNNNSMKIRADTNNPDEVPKVDDKFKVIRVEKKGTWWNIELERIEDNSH